MTDINGDTHPDFLVLNRNTGGNSPNGVLSLFLGDGAGNSVLAGTHPLAGDPAALVTGDFNGDGRQDVLIARNGVNRFADPAALDVLLGTGLGGLRPSGTFVMANGVGAFLRTGDLDADGALDLVYVADRQDRIGVMLGNGGGGFDVPQFYFVGTFLTDIALADFDRDGSLELISNPRDNYALSLARGDGRGGFVTPAITTTAPFSLSTFPCSLIPGDFDHDGSADLFVGLGGAGGRIARSTDGILQFAPPMIPEAAGTAGSDAAADFDLDGNLDVAIASGSFGRSEIRVILLDGKGGRKRHVAIPVADGIRWVSAADLNEDGWPDLLCSRRDQLRVFLARGNAEFDPAFSLAIGPFPPQCGPFGIGDLNGDGHLDLAVPNANVAEIHIFRGDGRGGFAVRPKLPLPSAGGGAIGTRIADLNGDGLRDLVTISGWGRGAVLIHLLKPDGTFNSLPELFLPGTLSAVEFSVGEYTGDARLDILCFSGGFGYRSAFVLPGDGTGRFSLGFGLVLPTSNSTLVSLDLNADGVLDLVAGEHPLNLATFLGKGRAEGNTFRSPPGDFAVLVRNADGTFTRQLKNGTRIEFNVAGFQTAIVDRNGNSTTYTYSGERLVEVTDPAGPKSQFSYAGDLLTSITNPDGRVTRFADAAERNLVAITDPDASVRRFGYDARNRMTSQTDKVGAVTRYAYNFAGQFMQADLPDGSTRKLIPTAAAGLADPATDQGTSANPLPKLLRDDVVGSSTDGNGIVTVFTYDAHGNLLRAEDNDTALAYTYDPCHRVHTCRTRILATTFDVTVTYAYNAVGERTKMTDSLGGLTQYQRDAVGRLSRLAFGGGREVTQTYDAAGRTTETRYPGVVLL